MNLVTRISVFANEATTGVLSASALSYVLICLAVTETFQLSVAVVAVPSAFESH